MFERLFGVGQRSPLIDSAFKDISSMLAESEKMLAIALESLLDNRPLEVDLDEMDNAVDTGEQMVRRSVLEHLSFSPKRELVPSLILVSMVQDAERIGDFARGLGELVPLAKKPREGEFADRLRAIAEQIRALFKLCDAGFREGDAAKSREVMATATRLKGDLLDYTRLVAESDLSADMAVVYSAGARILRRIGAHLSNISSSVVQPYDRIRHGDEDA